MSERIGILGGSFNPVHMGHLVMAQDAMERFALDRVLLIPARLPPHKPSPSLVGAGHRLEMLRLAAEGDPRLEVRDDEVRREGVSFTVDTLRELRGRLPEAALHFIIGGDTLRELHTWREITVVLELCTMVTVARPGFSADSVDAASLNLPAPWPARLLRNVVTGHLIGISATDIRQRVQAGRPIRYLVPDAVERYIREHQLYV